MADGVLAEFGAATREWFAAAFAAPTPAQRGAWHSVAAGRNALVVAPTGSGKTLAAFLWSLDRLAKEPPPADPRRRCRVLYVSPLKALAVDVERNLRAPLTGIRQAATRLDLVPPDITVGMRTGDTPADERRAFARTPPDILITTPESLFLLLTSAARDSLRGVDTVIVDEVHAVAGTKRGAHLALSLERLDALLERPAQRIGLSATVRPIDVCARFLGGARPVDVVQPPADKTIEVSVQVPVEDMTRLDNGRGSGHRPTIWPALEQQIFDLISTHRSTIVFVNSRGAAEQLCARLNELADQRPEVDSGCSDVRPPGSVLRQAGGAAGAPPVIARAHHGSVSREERKHIEEALKSGQLPAVVATSSLELGIDMGAVDLVVQIEAPPSVAAGLQRVGRAGHQVGAVSRGVVFPKHRGDLLSCTVVAERMGEGAIEELHYPRNPLDVLAQQIVAMVALEPWQLGDLAVLVRRAAPFAELPDSALHAVLDMLSGRYPSTAFAELRPRLVWDRATDVLTGRPGAQRLAVTSGGTIPDRGLFGVFLAGAERAARVGELDEEMVYESRVGDVFLLGSSSWRIEEITPDRVLVSPAPGAPARLPYWKSGQIGRPVQLGTAIGIRLRELSALDNQAADESLRHGGLDSWAASNLLAYLDEQRSATGALPDDQTVVVERFRDEVGDWRIAVHCPLGAQVNSPWAMAITQRLTERYGVDAHVMSFDDGIIIRLPYAHGAPPDAGLIVFDADDISARVHATVGQSALFASRFRECAARSLLLPRRHPGRRQPLWLQRQRAAQLLDVARDYAEFPITLEAARECLQDVYDVSALTHLMGQLNSRAVRLVEVETSGPSPFTRKMMFGYAAVFVYELDTPLAERRAAALSMDSTLLNELLGKADLQGLLDDEVLTETERHLQYLTPSRHVRRVDDIVDLLWSIGDLSDDELALRGVPLAWVRQLAEAGRIVEVCIDGQQRWITVEDLDRVSSALSSTSVVHAVGNETADSVGELVGRFARTHIPFSVHACARRFGLSDEVVQQALSTLSERGRVTAGHFTDREGQQWCDYDVLRTLRRRSLAAFRREIAPVAPSTLASFMPRWHRVNSGDTGVNAVMQALEQLQGFAAPASAWERLILPARVADYHPSLLDELCASGAVVWAGAGLISQRDGWLRFVFAETASLLVPPPDPRLDLTALHRQVLSELAGQQGKFFRTLWEDVGRPDETELEVVLWDLVWAGWITNDTLAPLRAALGAGGAHRGQRRQPLVQVRSPGRPATLQRLTQASVAGRWSKLPEREANLTERVTAVADVLLERHGVLTRGAVTAERVPGGFAALYPVLAAMEERGATRRGYFVEGLGAAQFCVPGAVDRLREADSAGSAVLAATDPAHPFGAALPWPRSTGAGDRRTKLGRPGRKPGAVVVLARGRLVLYLERGARSMLTFTDDRTDLAQSGALLAEAMQAGRLGPMVVERIDGNPVQASSPAAVIAGTRFRLTPSGLHLSAATTRG